MLRPGRASYARRSAARANPRSRSLPIADAVYARPDPQLIETAADAVELSPLAPGAAALEEQAEGAFEQITLLAPPGVLERRYVLAHALRVLAPGGRLTALAPKDKGGSRLAKELAAFGCAPDESARRHHRFCDVLRPDAPRGLEAAIAAGAPQIAPALGLWSQPGVFSWDRVDPGSALLLRNLPPLAGAGADFGCGVGLLARAVLERPTVQRLALVDIDRRAIEAARRNIDDARANFAWRDLRAGGAELENLDFVVMNPPFHDQGEEDRGLGDAFIRAAAAVLRPKGVCWLVANRHLPYEALLTPLFPRARQVVQADGYKVYEARR
jgi:16S rRNA (guanine1207-N2)-methyltransferase